jgi:hypothetical protein
MQRLIDAGLICTERAATLKDEHDLTGSLCDFGVANGNRFAGRPFLQDGHLVLRYRPVRRSFGRSARIADVRFKRW